MESRKNQTSQRSHSGSERTDQSSPRLSGTSAKSTGMEHSDKGQDMLLMTPELQSNPWKTENTSRPQKALSASMSPTATATTATNIHDHSRERFRGEVSGYASEHPPLRLLPGNHMAVVPGVGVDEPAVIASSQRQSAARLPAPPASDKNVPSPLIEDDSGHTSVASPQRQPVAPLPAHPPAALAREEAERKARGWL